VSAPEGRRLLVATAVTHYDKTPAWDRPGLVSARQQVIDLFVSRFGYTHLSELGLDPTKTQLTDQLRALCMKEMRPEDTLVVYFAGHGEILDDTDEHVLLTSETDAKDIENALPTATLARTLLLGTPVQRLLLLLDTCYSGRGGNEVAAMALAGMAREWDPKRGGFVVVSSALPAEAAGVAVFPDLLTAAVTSLATARNAPPALDIAAVVTAMNDNPGRPEHQRISWQPVGLSGQPPDFLPNPRNRSSSNRLRMTRKGRLLVSKISNGGLRLNLGSKADPGIVVAADASFLVRHETDQARVARVNRVTGAVAEWKSTIDLTNLDAGEVLAVGAAGPSDLAFVWAASQGTDLFLARHPGGAPEHIVRLSDKCASSAVLHQSRVLLSLPAQDGTSHECPSFPDIDVTSMVAASAGGRTLVLAIGLDADGHAGAWIEFDGRKRARVAEADAFLERALGSRNPPVVVTSAGQVLELSPEPDDGPPYDNWVPQPSAGRAASA
jgi:Caspase domain